MTKERDSRLQVYGHQTGAKKGIQDQGGELPGSWLSEDRE